VAPKIVNHTPWDSYLAPAVSSTPSCRACFFGPGGSGKRSLPMGLCRCDGAIGKVFDLAAATRLPLRLSLGVACHEIRLHPVVRARRPIRLDAVPRRLYTARQRAIEKGQCMRNVIIVGLGGFAGSISRCLVSGRLRKLSNNPLLPYGTLGGNVLGCPSSSSRSIRWTRAAPFPVSRSAPSRRPCHEIQSHSVAAGY
jgi:hypothetical protein